MKGGFHVGVLGMIGVAGMIGVGVGDGKTTGVDVGRTAGGVGVGVAKTKGVPVGRRVGVGVDGRYGCAAAAPAKRNANAAHFTGAPRATLP